MKNKQKGKDNGKDCEDEKDLEGELITDPHQRRSYIPHSLRVKYSIMIRNLSIHCRERDLRELFGSFASPIYQLTIERNDSDGRSLLHGFADCNDVEGGNRLIAEFDNRKFMGRRMRLERCEGSQRKIALQVAYASQFQIHFRYESMSQSESQSRVTEEMMERECGRYGEIVDVAIMRHTEYLDGEGRREIVFQKGYGFIYFLDGVGGERAAAARTLMIGGGRVRCEMGLSHQMHMEDRLHMGGEREESRMSSSSLSMSSSLSTRTPCRTVTPMVFPASAPSSFPANPSFPATICDLQSWFAFNAPFYPPSLLHLGSFPVPQPPYPPPFLLAPPPPTPPPDTIVLPPHVSSSEDAMRYQRWGPVFPPLSVIPTSMPSHPLPSMPTPYYPGSNEYVVRVSVSMSPSANYYVPPAALSPSISVSMGEDGRRGIRGGRGGRAGQGRSRRDRSESQSK